MLVMLSAVAWSSENLRGREVTEVSEDTEKDNHGDTE
jgi:hypothetical protein